MIDYTAIYDSCISVASIQVGSYLSQPYGIPSIYKERTKVPKLEYPFITIDIVETTERANYQIAEYINDNDHSVHEIVKTLMIHYTVHGGLSNSENQLLAMNIANQLQSSFAFHSVRDKLRSEVGGAIKLIQTARNQPILLADGYIESANFFVLMDVIDSQEDVNSTVISSVEATGEIYSSTEDVTPILQTITIQSP